MKKLNLLFIAISMLLLTGCKTETPDLSGLLRTVPSSAAAVAGVNIRSIAEDLGCKVSDNEIKPGNEVKEFIENMKDSDKAVLLSLLAGDSGIMPECAVLFIDTNRTFITLSLYDSTKFKDFVKQRKGGDFISQNDGVEILQNIAIKDNQAWFCLSSAKPIDPNAIAAYSSLSQSQSFLNTDMAEPILEADSDIIGWGNFNMLLSILVDRSDLSMASIASGLLFEGIEAVEFDVDFKKGEMEAEVIPLNGKGKPSKYLLPAEKIDINTLKEIKGNCYGLLAFTITPKLIQKIEKVGSALGGSLFGELQDVFENIDGTVGVAKGETISDFKGIASTKGKVSSDLRNLLSMFADKVTQENNRLFFSTGDVSGTMAVENVAEELKGYTIGFVADMQTFNSLSRSNQGIPSAFSKVIFGLEPDSGSLKANIEIKTVNENENFLMAIIKNKLDGEL